jgi:geranylgeranyl diphosphate synthase type I
MKLMEELKTRAAMVDDFVDRQLSNRQPEELYRATMHLLRAGGKRLRPAVTMLACEAAGGDASKALPAAVAIELVHNFTLIHDDIMDQDSLRRGIPAVHTLWGCEGAILAGDTLYALSFEILSQLEASPEQITRCVHLLSAACVEICEGQWEDISFEQRESVSEAEYLQMVEKKTSVLYAAAARIGAILAGAGEDAVEALGEYGRLTGIGFQIYDDVLDLIMPEETLGKNRGSDLAEGKKTLIITHAQSVGEKIPIFGKKDASREEIEEAIQRLQECGSITYAQNKALEYVESGKNQLRRLPDTPAKQVLLQLADYMITRQY